MNLAQSLLLYLAIALLVVLLLPACSYNETKEGNSTLLPATVLCFFASCQAEFSDRNQRDGSVNEDSSEMKQETEVEVGL